jgi:GlpG protein
MKKLGVIENSEAGRVFSDYLLSQGIENKAEFEDDGVEIWIVEESQLEYAKVEFDLFSINPKDAKYFSAVKTAHRIRKEQINEEKKRSKLHHSVKQSFSRHGGVPRFTLALIIISVVLSVIFHFGNAAFIERIFFIQELHLINDHYYSAKQLSIGKGEIWRLVTPIFLHFSILHILFNMMWLKDLGGMIEARKGWLKFLLLVFSIGIFSNLVQYYFAGPVFGGMSGVVYGLLGYVYIKMKVSPHEGLGIDHGTFVFMMIWLVLCMTPLISNIANYAHVAGLVSGAAIAYFAAMMRKR